MKKFSIIAAAFLIQFAFQLNVQASETLFSESFDLISTGALPADWLVTTNASTSVAVSEIPDASDKSLQLDDADALNGVEARVSFSAHQGPVNASWSFMESGASTAGEGSHMALLAGDFPAVELFTIDGNLVYRDLDGTDHVLQAVAKDTWYDVTVAADPTHFTADIYVGGVLKLDGASFQHTTTRLNGILFGSSNAWAADTLNVNDITVSKADLVLDENFDAMATDAEPSDWQVTTNTDTAVTVSETPSSTNKSMRIIDSNASGFSKVWKSFDPMDRPFTASWKFMVTGNEEGHRMQLLSGTNVVVELATTVDEYGTGNLRYTRPSGNGYDLGIPTPNVWHEISITLNLAASKADVYLDGVLKWSHRELLNTSVSTIDRVLFGSSDVTDQYDLYVDNVTVDAEPVYVIEPLDVSTPRLPMVIKLDDLSGYSVWWQRVTDFAADRQLSISPGIFGNTLGGASGTYLSYLESLNNDPSVEIFLHAYDHVDPEFQGTGYTYQKNHIEWTQAAAESTLGSRLTVFGASFGRTDADTLQVLSEDSDIQIWLFPDQTNFAGKTPLLRVAGVNIEESTFVPDPEAFVTGYKANADANDYFVIQGHPNNWTDARWYNFVRLIDYLEDNDIPTMTPSALVSMLSGPDTNAPTAPASVTAVAGDNTVFLDWADNAESDVDSYTVYRSITSGTNYSVLASNLTDSACEDSSAVNGTTYYYVVTATDTSTNESPVSAEVSAMPAVDSTAPSAPTGLVAVAGNSAVSLDWDDNAESDLATYTLYRSTTSGSGYIAIASNLTASAYGDSSAVNDTTYYYVVTATDFSDNESVFSTEVSALPQANTVGYWRFEGGASGTEIVTAASEFNSPAMDGEQWDSNATNVLYSSDVAGAYIYDPLTLQHRSNAGSMLAPGTAGSDNSMILVNDMSVLDGAWTLEMFVKVEEGGAAVSWPASAANRLFNLDGVTSCNGSVGATSGGSTLLQFRLGSTIYDYSSNFEDAAWHHLAYVVSYDGTNTTTELFRDYTSVGTGSYAGKFTSQSYQDLRFGISSAANVANIDWFLDDVRLSDGALTANQFLQATDEDPIPIDDTTPPSAPVGLAATAGDGTVSLDWDDNVESDLAGYTVYRSTTSGSGYGILVSNLTASAFEDSSVVNDTTYYYVLTATDTSTNESATSAQVFATPVADSSDGVDTIGYWRFEEGADGSDIVTATDSSTNDYDAVNWSGNEVTGKYSTVVGGAYVYDPVADTYRANTLSFLAPAGTAGDDDTHISAETITPAITMDGWTFEMFIKTPTNLASSWTRIGNIDGNARWNLNATSSSLNYRMDTSIDSSSTTVNKYGNPTEDGEWHHVAYTVDYDGSSTTTIEMFFDYVSAGSVLVDGQFLPSTSGNTALRFGRDAGTDGDGDKDWYFDEARLSASVLATNQFLQLTNQDPSEPTPDVETVGYWRFEEGTNGNVIAAASSEVNSPSMDGEQWSSNGTNVLYSSDVAGAYVYDPVAFQYSANTVSMLAPGTAGGENSQIVVHDMSALTNGSFTLEMFVKVEDGGEAADWFNSANNRLFNLDGSVSCNGTVGATSSGTTLLKFMLGSTIYDYSSNFERGNWHHLAYVVSYDGTNTTTELFRDYTSVGTGSLSGQFVSDSGDDLRFGISTAANIADLDWFLDEVRLSDGALATNQFLQVSDQSDSVPPEAASTPVPSDSSTDVGLGATLNWTAGSGAVSHNVYFGTNSLLDVGDLRASQTNTSYIPGTLSTNTTYYWRVDEVNAIGTTTGSVWSFTTIAAETVETPDVSNVTHVIFFGASITDGISDHQISTIEEEFLQTYGLDVTVTNYAQGGRGVVEALTDWEALKWQWTGVNALVVIHTIGNDVSDYRPWSTLAQTTKDELYDATSNLVASIKANGNIPLLVNTTFRNYDGTTINNEDVGSKPFNDNIINPIAATLDPVMYTNGAPYIDPYDFTRNRNTAFQTSDGVHYTQQGYGILRRFWVENIARRILGQAPYTEARIEDPSSPTTSPQKTLIHFDTMDTGDSWYIFGTHQFAGSQTTLDQGLTPLEGYAVNSIRASLDSGPVSANHNSNALDTGDTSKTLSNDSVKNFSIRTASNTWVTAMSFTGFEAGQSVDISIAAYKNATGTGSIGEYTTDGGTNIVTIDASLENSGSHTLTIPSTADESGAITLEFRAQAGSDYAYLNGILLDPQTSEAPAAASLPVPADSAINVSADAILSWTAGSNAVSHNVYFGTNSPLTGADLQANQTNTVYDPGTLSKDATYYWRVDEVNESGTTEGAEWSFSTVTNYAVADVTHVIFFGASITEGIALNGTVDKMIAQEFSDTYGLDLVVTNFTQGGREVAEGLAAWEVAKTNWTGTKALVVIHPIANNMLHNGVWSELDQATKDEFFNDTSNLVESVKNNGNIPMLVNTAFVNYSGETLSYDTSVLTNEVLGTLPYNENIIDVIAPTLDPVMVTNGTTFLEMYNFTRNRNTSIQTTDGIHYTQQGYSILRRYWVENIARRILGQAPYMEDRIEDPSSPTTSVQSSLIHFTTFEGSGYSWNVFGAHQFMTSKTMTDEGLTPMEGYEANSVLASFDPTPVQGGHNSKAFDTGDTTTTLANDTVKNYYIRTTSNTWVNAMTFSGFEAGQSVNITIAAYKNAYGTGSIGEYTTDGGVTIATLDASLDNSGSHTLTLAATADGSGEVVLEFRAQAGSGYGYLSGIFLEPQADQLELPAVTASVSGSEFIISWAGGGSYTVLTNSDLTNPDGWGELTSGTSPLTNAIGSDPKMFYKLQAP